MKHAIIGGHPDQNSFTAAIANTYATPVSGLGHTSVTRDLYRLEFDPRLQLSEMPTRPDWKPAADVEAERQLLRDADVFAFIYPLWFSSPPKIVKGYIERVFGEGFGYTELRGGQGPLLNGRHLIHVSASGSTSAWLNQQGVWLSTHNLFATHFAKLCGLHLHPHILFDSVVPGLAQRWVATNLKTLETKPSEYWAST